VVISGFQQGGEIDGVQDVVGSAGGGVVGFGQVLAGLDEDAGDAGALGRQDVGLDVVSDHQRLIGVDSEAGQRRLEERGCRFTGDLGLGAGGLLQTEQERAGVE
jgi:hypothetical protein